MKFYKTNKIKYNLEKQKYSSKNTHKFLITLLDIYKKKFIPIVSLILLYKNITTKNHQSHFKNPFTNLLIIINYNSIKFSKQTTSSKINPFNPLTYKYLLTNNHNQHTLINKKITNTINNKKQNKLTTF